MRFERLTIEDGLSQSFVNCLHQDSTGFLWIGTQNGLNRYDGYQFTVFRHDPADPKSLPHDWILALHEDTSGDLWIGTEGGGLGRWLRRTNEFRTYQHDPEDTQSLSGDSIVALAEDGAGFLWIGTRDSGLNRLDPKTGHVERFRHDPEDPTSLASDKTFTIHVDTSGAIWIGTTAGLDLFDPDRRIFLHQRHDPKDPRSLSDNRVRTLTGDRQGTLWVGTHRGLNRLTIATGRFERFLHDPNDPDSLSHNWIRDLLKDSDGRLWIATDGGLNLWQGKRTGTATDRGAFVSYHPDPADPTSLASDQIVHLYQDRGGVLWLAPVGAGLNRWNPARWSFPLYTNDEAGASNMVFSISEDAEGDLWIGTFGGGLERLDRATGERSRYLRETPQAPGLSDDRVTALLHDRQDVLWIGTIAGGLNRFAAGTFEHFRHDPEDPESLSSDAVTTIHQDVDGRLWIGTLGGGLDLVRGGIFRPHRHDPDDPSSLSNDRIFSIADSQSGALWLATDGGGLNQLNPETSEAFAIRHDPDTSGSLASDELLVVHTTKDGTLWVGTKNRGLDMLTSFDEETGQATFHNYSRSDGLPDDTIWGILSDHRGELWISTNNGLARLDHRTGLIAHYSSSHGLQSNEFNMGASFASSRGEIFFGGVGGLNGFFPDQIVANRQMPPMAISSVVKSHQPMSFETPVFDVSEITLAYPDHTIAFEVAVLDFTAPQRNQYRYKLEGFEDYWVDNGQRRWVSFTNLDPGDYRLYIQGANSAGVWNHVGTTVQITVDPPPWRTSWAYALYGLAFLGLLGAVAGVYSQHRQVIRERAVATYERERSKERERMLAEQERLANERERLHAKLQDSYTKLGEMNAELKRFNYTVSHDLKTPLVTIKGFLGMLEQDLADGDLERVGQDLVRIQTATTKMTALLDDLLGLARASDPTKMVPEEVALGGLVEEALDLIQGLTTERGVQVRVDPGLPVIRGDRVRLREVFQNLLTNAVKYMGDQPKPFIEVGLRNGSSNVAKADTEPVNTEPTAQRIFYVRDNGQGIEPRFQDKVFGLFERIQGKEEGTGIGLALVRRIVEMHGGRVWVESEGLGQGAAFCFTLAESMVDDSN